ncbi:hypothetical protein BDQ17DRAFT_989067 [Cyathus striatus]|nr:hypothetical protein BDQ17DRAFT_989067 [Cyathus striatus]
MATASNIPFEITEAIVDAIDDHDISSIRTCALVHRDFLDASRRRLFSSVTLEFKKWPKPTKYIQFQSALLSSPELAVYIRELIICGEFDSHIFGDSESALPTIIDMLQNLTSFSVHSYALHQSWQSAFTPDLKRALVSILLSPSIEKFSLGNLHHIPITLAKCFTRIPCLTLSGFGDLFQGNSDDEMATVPQQLLNIPNNRCLNSLTIYDPINRECLQPLLDEIDSSICKLEKLSTFYNGSRRFDVIATTSAFIAKSKNTLTTLEFTNVALTDGYLDISNLKHLRTITLSADTLPHDPLKDIRTVLSRAPNDNKIQEIIIEFYCVVHGFYDVTKDDNLDALLMGPLFSRLRKVLFRISGIDYGPSDVEEFKGYLPKTSGSESVRVEIEYNEMPNYKLDLGRGYETEYVPRSHHFP